MSYNHFYRAVEKIARAGFPGLTETDPVDWTYLISPLEIQLPRSVFAAAESAIGALHRLSRNAEYARRLGDAPLAVPRWNQDSVLMAYDFHTDEAGACYLVEVNTNASGFMLAALMECAHAGATSLDGFEPLDQLRSAFVTEARACGLNPADAIHCVIADDGIDQQKMRAEFFMYRDWFAAGGWRSAICEASELSLEGGRLARADGQAVDLVYNRSTDFYFEDPVHATLAKAYGEGLACVTPNPRAYWLLADKQRLVQWGEPDFLASCGLTGEDAAAIQSVLIPTFDRSHFADAEQIWQERKRLFFKPKRSHGGKSVYRGESVSRKVFERLMQEDVLIQRYQPAQKFPIDDPRSVMSNWKFDLRFFVYGDHVQMAVARSYQGQVTNFSSPYGGFTRVTRAN